MKIPLWLRILILIVLALIIFGTLLYLSSNSDDKVRLSNYIEEEGIGGLCHEYLKEKCDEYERINGNSLGKCESDRTKEYEECRDSSVCISAARDKYNTCKNNANAILNLHSGECYFCWAV